MSQLALVNQRYHVGHIASTEDIHSGYGFAIGNVAAFDMGPVLKQGVMRKLRCLNMDHQMRMCVYVCVHRKIVEAIMNVLTVFTH